MSGIYIGATSGYSGKNTIALGLSLWLRKHGRDAGYMRPVGALPVQRQTPHGTKWGDEDAFFMQEVLELDEDPALVTPVLVTAEFKKDAFTGTCGDLMADVQTAYQALAARHEVMVVGGSGSMYSGKYCGVDGISMVRTLDIPCVIVDRFSGELNYDHLVALREQLGDRLAGIILNDVPQPLSDETRELHLPFLERAGVHVLGIIPRDPLMGAIKVNSLAERLGGKVISAAHKADRVVENFLIGTMQVENFLTHFKKHANSAVIVGGDRSDLQLVALEGDCPCIILTGNLYPNDIIMTRSEVLEIPLIMVREDTFSVAKKMEDILSRHKLRDHVKVRQAEAIVRDHVDLAALCDKLGL